MNKMETKIYWDVEYIKSFVLGDISQDQLRELLEKNEAAYKDSSV